MLPGAPEQLKRLLAQLGNIQELADQVPDTDLEVSTSISSPHDLFSLFLHIF